MYCKKCGSPLPKDGVICKFCKTAMSQEQINERNKIKNKQDQNIILLSEKYGQASHIEYRPKENKFLGMIIIVITLLVLIILAILINVN